MRPSSLALVPCLMLCAFAPAEAQTVYRCTEGDRTIWSDRPCPGASVVQDASPAVAKPARPSGSYTPPVAKGGVLPQKHEVAGLRMVREQEIVIACDGGGRGTVVARRDIQRYRLPDGSAHGSLDAAAAVLCAR